YVQKAIYCHERNELEKAAHFFRLAACQGSPVGLFLYGISLRHGWGCKANPQVAFQCLQKAAECAVFDLNNLTNNTNLSAAKHELVLAIYELGVCFQNGWGVSKNKATAAYYFEIAANLGDPDAQNDLAFCYLHGHGVKKDQYKAAKYYRMAYAQGLGVVGNSWIFKEKYDNV
ncbi:HCP-like protein, partial [Basidiobolus meristosporus CBS 931.73]